MVVFSLSASTDISWLTTEQIFFPWTTWALSRFLGFFDIYWLSKHIPASTEDCLSTISQNQSSWLYLIFCRQIRSSEAAEDFSCYSICSNIFTAPERKGAVLSLLWLCFISCFSACSRTARRWNFLLFCYLFQYILLYSEGIQDSALINIDHHHCFVLMD